MLFRSAAGNYTYTIIPIIGGNEGTPISANVYIGVAKPVAPTNITLVETDTDGIVTIGWDAVTVNEYGYAMSPELVSYSILTVGEDPELVATDIKGTSHTFRATDERSQTFVEYSVVAGTDAGLSAAAVSPLIAVGKPYSLPMDIHVDDRGFISHNVSINGDWSLAAMSNDRNEDGFVFRLTPELNKTASLGSGKVAIPADARNPIFTFYYYTWKSGESGASNDIAYATINGERIDGGFPLGASDGWAVAIIPLDAYKGTSVVVGVEIDCKPLTGGLWYYPIIDGVSVTDPYTHDIMVKGLDVPLYIKPGDSAAIEASFKNIGKNDADNIEVELMRNGISVQTITVSELKAATSKTVTFKENCDASWPEKVEYQVVVNCKEDENIADNSSEIKATEVFFDNYPIATGLIADINTPDGILLSWEAPALGNEPVQVTETFEDCRSFAVNDIMGWTFFDIDKDKTYSFGGDDTYPNKFAKMAYIVFDASHFATPDVYAAHNGNKYMATFASYSGKNDDWAVSPLLSGDEQTVTFYAKSYNDKYGLETFEVQATKKRAGFTIEDFETVGEKGVAPVSWKKYSYKLPAGTRHFAIRCTSEDKFFFQVDDITFTAASEAERIPVVGYNVYRGDTRLNEIPLAETTFIDNAGVANVADYRVSVVYERGESRLSKPADEYSGIAATVADGDIKMSVSAGIITVCSGLRGLDITVYKADGSVVGSAVSSGASTDFTVSPGVYIVKAGSRVAKVVVR